MSQFNRMNEFFESDFDFEADEVWDDWTEDRGYAPLANGFLYHINLPETPDKVKQMVKVIDGRLVIHLEFEFEDIDLLDSTDDI